MSVTLHAAAAEGPPVLLVASARSASVSGTSPLVPQRPRLLRVESAERSDNGPGTGNGGGSHTLLQQQPTLRQSSSAEEQPSPLDHSRQVRPRFTPSSHAIAQLQGSPSVVAAARDASQDGMPALSVGPPALTPRKDHSMRPAPALTTTPSQQSDGSCCCWEDCSRLFCCFRDSQKMCTSHWAGKRLQLSVALQLIFTIILPLAGVLILLGMMMTRSMHETHEAKQTQQNLEMAASMAEYMQRNGAEMGWAALYALQLASAAAAPSSGFNPASLGAHTMLTRSAFNTDRSLMHLSAVVVDQVGAVGAALDPGALALYSSSSALLASVSFSQTFEWMRWQSGCRDQILNTSRADLRNITWEWPESLRPILFAPTSSSSEDAVAMMLRAVSDASSSNSDVEDLSALAQYSPRLSSSAQRFSRSYLTLHSSLLRTLRSLLTDTLRRTQRTGDTVGIESSAALSSYAELVETQEIMLVQTATNLAIIDALNATDSTASGPQQQQETEAIAALVRASAEVDLRVQLQMTNLLRSLSHEETLALAARQQALPHMQIDAMDRVSTLQSSINTAAASGASSANVTATLLALGIGSISPSASDFLADSLVAPSLLSEFGRATLLDPLGARTSARFNQSSSATIGLLFLIVFLSVSASIAGAYQVRTVWMLQRREHDRMQEGGMDKEQLMRQGTLMIDGAPASSRAFSLNLTRQASFLGTSGNPKAPPPSPGLFASSGNGNGRGSGGSGGSAFFPRLSGSGGSGGSGGVVANSNANGLGLFGSPSLGPRRATMDASSPGAPPAAGVIGAEFVAPPSQPLPSPPSGSSNLSLPLDTEGGSLILMAGSPLRRNGDRHVNGPSPHRSHGHGHGGKDRHNSSSNHRHNNNRPAYGSAQVSQFLQAEFENVMGPALLPRSSATTGGGGSHHHNHQHRSQAQHHPDPLTPINMTGFGFRSLEIPLLNFDALLPPDGGNATDDRSPATPSSNWTVTHTNTQHDASATNTSRDGGGAEDPMASAREREMSTLHEENDVQALSTFASACPTPYDESARSRMGSPTNAAREKRRNIIAGTLSFGVPSPPKDVSPATVSAGASVSAAAPAGGRLFVPVSNGGGSGGGSGGPASASRSSSSNGNDVDRDRDPLVGHGVLFVSAQSIGVGGLAQQQHRNRGSSGAGAGVTSNNASEHSSSMSVPAADSPSPVLVGDASSLPSAVRFAPGTLVHSPPAAAASASQVLRQLRVSDPLAALSAYSLSNATANAKANTAALTVDTTSPVHSAPVAPLTPPLPPLFLSIAPLASAGLVIAASPGSDPLQGLSLTPRLDAPPPASTSPSLQLDRPSTTHGDGPSGRGSVIGGGSGGGGGTGVTRTTTREGGTRGSGDHSTVAAPHTSPSSMPVVLRSARSDGQ